MDVGDTARDIIGAKLSILMKPKRVAQQYRQKISDFGVAMGDRLSDHRVNATGYATVHLEQKCHDHSKWNFSW